MNARPSRPAFTLLELLVVIALLAVLVGLLLSAVQRVRAAADRVTCANRLRQIGLALHGYHETHRTLPPGMSGPRGVFPYPFLSWNARILPYLEQHPLWREVQRAYDQDPDFLHLPPHVHRQTVVRDFSCPSDRRTLTLSTRLRGPQMAFTAYLGVAGIDFTRNDGLLFLDSRVRLADIADGTSNTLLVGERPPSTNERFGWWYAGWGQSQDGSAEMVLGVRERNVSDRDCWEGHYSFGSGRLDNQCDMYHFWSLHTGGGAHFLFGDGSVRFLPYSAAPLMRALATRQGGEAVTPDG